MACINIFDKISNLHTSKTIWAHFAPVAIYPTRLRLKVRLTSITFKMYPYADAQDSYKYSGQES